MHVVDERAQRVREITIDRGALITLPPLRLERTRLPLQLRSRVPGDAERRVHLVVFVDLEVEVVEPKPERQTQERDHGQRGSPPPCHRSLTGGSDAIRES